MHVLVVSSCSDFSIRLVEKLKKEGYSVVFLLLGGDASSIPGAFKVFRTPLSSSECHIICRNYHFQAAIFLAGAHGSRDTDEMSLEMSVFQAVLCASKWRHVILQSDCHLFAIDANDPVATMESRDRNVAETQIVLYEIFFQSYCLQRQVPLSILRTGYIYDPNSSTSDIAALFSEGSLPRNMHPEDDVNLLHIGDALEAFTRCLSGNVTGTYNVCAAWWLNAGSLCSQILERPVEHPEIEPRQIIPDRNGCDFYFPAAYATFKQRTDWVPLGQLHNGMPQRPAVTRSTRNRIKPLIMVLSKRIKPVIETFVGFAIAVALQYVFSGIASLKGFDMLIVFITLVACKYGVGLGFVASLLGCASHYYNNIGTNTSITDILLLSNLWMPLIVYLLLGTVLGYWSKLRGDEIGILCDSLKAQERRYGMLLELHEDTLVAKDILQEQIFNLENSFGKVSQMIEQLNSLQSDKVMASAPRVFGQAIHAEHIAVYSLSPDGRYARLVSCSNGLNSALHSVDLSESPHLKQVIEANELYISRQLSGGISYACPIFNEGRAMYFIALYGCSLHQFTLAFQNQFRVVCSLVQNSLVQALHYEQATWRQNHVDNTLVLKTKSFKERMSLMETDDSEKFKRLIFLVDTPTDIKILDYWIAPILRQHDFIGIAADNRIYAVFLAIREGDGDNIIRRMGAAGVILQPIIDKKELNMA